MFLIIVLIVALCLGQNVLGVPERNLRRANSTNGLFKRDGHPTYAIDLSCSRFDQVPYVVNDWYQIAQETSRRVNLGANDREFWRAMSILFGTDIGSDQKYEFEGFNDDEGTALEFTALEFITLVTSNIASFEPHTDVSSKANLIFFCDDDAKNTLNTPYSAARWQPRPDLRNDPVPNSRRMDGVNKEWFDQYNFILRYPTTNGCKDDGTERGGNSRPTWMETYKLPVKPFPFAGRNAPLDGYLKTDRSTITMCDRIFDTHNNFYTNISSSMPFTLSRPRARQYPLALDRDPYDRIMSATLYHESTHWEQIILDDNAYGWSDIQNLDTHDRLFNADSFMFLGLLARYESLGYLLWPTQLVNGRYTNTIAESGGMTIAPAGFVPP